MRIGGLTNIVGLRILGDLHHGLRNFVPKRKDPRIVRETADDGFTDLMTRNVDLYKSRFPDKLMNGPLLDLRTVLR